MSSEIVDQDITEKDRGLDGMEYEDVFFKNLIHHNTLMN